MSKSADFIKAVASSERPGVTGKQVAYALDMEEVDVWAEIMCDPTISSVRVEDEYGVTVNHYRPARRES